MLRRPRFDDPVLDERAETVHGVLLLCSGAHLLLVAAGIAIPSLSGGLPWTVPLIGMYVVAWYLLRRGHVTAVGRLTIGILTLALTLLSLFGGGFETGATSILVGVALMGALMLGPRTGAALTVWALAVQIGVYVFGSSDLLLHDLERDDALSRLVALLFQTALIGAMVTWTVELLRRNNATIREQATSLARAHAASEVTMRAAEEANRTKSMFLANMSHELRTPLNAVLGYAEMLMENLDGEDATDAERIHRAGTHLLSLINDVLDMSKIDAGRMDLNLDLVALSVLVSEVTQTLAPTAQRRGNTIEVSVPPELAPMWLDDRKARQILMNLLSNACKFTEGGTVRIEVSETIDGVRIDVSDTGMGIAPDRLSELFQPFVQVHTKRADLGGTGLGLALSRRFVEMMHGWLEVESELGVGSTFTVWLPDLERWGSRIDPGHEPLVLCIDDDLPTLELVARILRREGLRTARAMTMQRALRHVANEAPVLVILGLRLPDGTGWEALARIRSTEAGAGVPAVVLSDVDPGPEARQYDLGDYLVKPVQPGRLVGAVRSALRVPRQVSA